MSAPNPYPFRPQAVSVTAMAKAVGLSRSQFYTYINRGVFPWPLYSLATKRPFYTTEMQDDIIESRQTGVGCNGQFVLFYERRSTGTAAPPPSPRRASHTALIDGLKSLGLTNVTHAQVEAALAAAFPEGVGGQDDTVVLRAVYRQIRRSIGGR